MGTPPTDSSGTRANTARGSANWLHGESKGAGWGGPARGSKDHSLVPHVPFKPGNTTAKLNARMTSELRAERKAQRAERAQKLEDILFEIAQESQRDDTRVNAAVRLHAILDGLPVARVVTVDASGALEINAADPVAASEAYQRLINGG